MWQHLHTWAFFVCLMAAVYKLHKDKPPDLFITVINSIGRIP